MRTRVPIHLLPFEALGGGRGARAAKSGLPARGVSCPMNARGRAGWRNEKERVHGQTATPWGAQGLRCNKFFRSVTAHALTAHSVCVAAAYLRAALQVRAGVTAQEQKRCGAPFWAQRGEPSCNAAAPFRTAQTGCVCAHISPSLCLPGGRRNRRRARVLLALHRGAGVFMRGSP